MTTIEIDKVGMTMDDDDGDDNRYSNSDNNSNDNSEYSRFGIDIGYTDCILLMG